MTQADREREKGARQHAGGGALFGLNKGRHADIQIPHTHTSQQEDKREKQNRKIKNKILDWRNSKQLAGSAKSSKKEWQLSSAGTSKESTNHRNWRWQRQERRRHCANNAAGAAPINNGLSGKWQKGGIGTAKSPPYLLWADIVFINWGYWICLQRWV